MQRLSGSRADITDYETMAMLVTDACLTRHCPVPLACCAFVWCLRHIPIHLSFALQVQNTTFLILSILSQNLTNKFA